MSETALLRVRNLHVALGTERGWVHPVRGVSFDLRAGETLGIAGESGSGKSLTLMALLGLLPRGASARATEMSFDGEDLTRITASRRRRLMATGLATIFQDPMTCLNPVLTVGALLEEVYLVHRNGSRAEARARATALLDRVGIPRARERLGQYPHELSGGMRQRVMIAMALMCEPKLLLADEPTTALDVTVQAGILDLLAELQRDLGLAIILVSHDLGVIARLSQRLAVMYAGQFVETGEVARVLRAPAHPYSEALLRSIPRADVAHGGHRLEPIPGQVRVMTGDLSGCQFRDRCRFAQARCADADPPVLEAGPERRYRCHYEPGARVARHEAVAT